MTLFTPPLAPDSDYRQHRPTHETQLRALILDDSEVDRLRVRRMANSGDLDVSFVEATTIAEFASKLDQGTVDIVFLDYRLVQGDGLIALEMLRRHPLQSKVPSIMIAGEGQIQIAVDALKNGCNDYLIKGNLTPELLQRSISHAVEASSLRASLSAETEVRDAMQNSLGRFANSCGSEMRGILSGMLRRARGMRRNVSTITAEDVSGLEASCERLWDFLEEFQSFVSEAATTKPRVAERHIN